MLFRNFWSAIIALLFLGCDSDSIGQQGRCEEGFVEEIGPDNTYFCVENES